ncbi:hypothetical protein C8A05DRAFT_16694 [Staphylotrichum tortipilum]|uniref:BHLH domain-containing protein n=1 Tax=Staphylotrichum tortipilum TaxID=2831512 RepID=A0AAN6MHP2_9PEZI|nr:hypothetical protein C8A05DRAFT_16694 [Staphylotrichum longicolle]
MSGITIDPSMSFDPYATSFDAAQLQTYSDFSPVLFDTEDFATDFTSDSAASPLSPLSPLSPALSASSFGFPTTDAWTAWEAAELSPEPENLFGAPQTFSPCPTSNPALTPAINPKDLAVAVAVPAQVQVQVPQYFQSPQVMMAAVPLPIQQQHMHTQMQLQPLAALPTTLPASTPSTAIPSRTTTATKRYPSRGLKRKSSTDRSSPTSSSDNDDDEPPAKSPIPPAGRHPVKVKVEPKEKEPTPAPKKTAHNMIEKRYRTNLNDKITQLREAVPSLRLMAQRSQGISPMSGAGATEGFDEEEEGQNGSSGNNNVGGAKLNKATILSKATEYILQLERRNHGLETENSALRGRMEGLEMMLMGGGGARAGMGWN